jgi:hypothetical protein
MMVRPDVGMRPLSRVREPQAGPGHRCAASSWSYANVRSSERWPRDMGAARSLRVNLFHESRPSPLLRRRCLSGAATVARSTRRRPWGGRGSAVMVRPGTMRARPRSKWCSPESPRRCMSGGPSNYCRRPDTQHGHQQDPAPSRRRPSRTVWKLVAKGMGLGGPSRFPSMSTFRTARAAPAPSRTRPIRWGRAEKAYLRRKAVSSRRRSTSRCSRCSRCTNHPVLPSHS